MYIQTLKMNVQYLSTLHNGKQKTTERSLPSAPFTAYLENGNLFIQNNSGTYDLTITITSTQTGDEVYSQESDETAGTYIIISIADLPSGDYQLNISNPDSGHVYGYFNK